MYNLIKITLGDADKFVFKGKWTVPCAFNRKQKHLKTNEWSIWFAKLQKELPLPSKKSPYKETACRESQCNWIHHPIKLI